MMAPEAPVSAPPALAHAGTSSGGASSGGDAPSGGHSPLCSEGRSPEQQDEAQQRAADEAESQSESESNKVGEDDSIEGSAGRVVPQQVILELFEQAQPPNYAVLLSCGLQRDH